MDPLQNVYWCLDCGEPTDNHTMHCGMCEEAYGDLQADILAGAEEEYGEN